MNMTDESLPLMPAIADSYDELIAPLFSLPRRLPTTAWTGHIPFLFALFRTLRPTTYVELGVHFGASLIAAATAASAYDVGARIVGVDTWAGDDHAGHYQGNSIHDDLKAFTSRSFSSVELMRMTFDEARGAIAEQSVDLLHIDGLHTYEAVRHDFELWLPTVGPNGVVMFHDTAVHERGFGVWRLWEELASRYPSIEFTHSHGLGVLFPKGTDGLPPSIQKLIADKTYFHGYRNLVSEIGELLPLRSAYLTGGLAEQPDTLAASPVSVPGNELQRELENTRWMLQHYTNEVAKIRGEFENSRSWKITAPLRKLTIAFGRRR